MNQGVAGGAVAGATAGAYFGPWGAAIGAVAGAALSINQQNSAIKAANKYNKTMRNSEVTGLMYQNRGRTTQQLQIEQNIQDDRLNTKLQALQEAGKARVYGASTGTTGRTMENIQRFISEQTEKALSVIDSNFKNTRAAYNEDIKGNQFATSQRIMSQAQGGKFSKTAVVGAAISGGMSGMQFANGMAASTKSGAETPTRNPGVSTLRIGGKP